MNNSISDQHFLWRVNAWIRKPVGIAMLLLLHLILSITCTRFKDINGDERGYMIYAARILKGENNRVKFDDSKTSLISIAYIPRIAEQLFNPGLKKSDWGDSDVRHGRYIIMFVSLLAMFYLWLFLRAVDLPYSLLVLPFAATDPLWLTYASLVLSDIIAGLCAIAMIYHSYKYYKAPSYKQLVLASLSAGLGLVAKFSFLPVLLAFVIGVIVILNKRLLQPAMLGKLAKVGVLSGFIILLVINMSYPTDIRFRSLKQDAYKSRKITAIQQSWLGEIPLPIPQNIMQAADLLSYHSQPDLPFDELTSNGGTFIFNRYYERDTVWYYYWAVLLYKTPLFVLLLSFTGIVIAFIKWKRFTFLSITALIICFFLFYGGFFNPFQIGSRHLMAVYPLLFIPAGLSIYQLSIWLSPRKMFVVTATGTLWFLASVAYYYPHTFYYTNELIPDKKDAHRFFVEGVNDYVLSSRYVQEFMQKNPQYKTLDQATDVSEPIAVTMGTLNKRAFMLKDSFALALWKRKPDDVKRFVLLIFNEPQPVKNHSPKP